MARHQQLNDLVWHALCRAHVPSVKEPPGLARSDGIRPDGLTLIPWRGGRSLLWDVTVADTLAVSYLHISSVKAGAVAELAATKKHTKYLELAGTRIFCPLAFETLGPICEEGVSFINELGLRLAAVTGDPRKRSFLYQRLSIAIQRCNAISFLGSFCTSVDPH